MRVTTTTFSNKIEWQPVADVIYTVLKKKQQTTVTKAPTLRSVAQKINECSLSEFMYMMLLIHRRDGKSAKV